MIALEARGLAKSVLDGGSSREILRGLDLRVSRGELVVIFGPSGSGKSTLLSLLGGFETPDSGSVRLFGHELRGTDEETRARLRREHVSFLFQRFHLFDGLSVERNVTELARLLGVAPDEAQRRTATALEQLGLSGRARQRAGALSGGEKQRVALARALVSPAQLLLCDEPTSALDAPAALEVTRLLSAAADAGRAVICTTHDARFAKAASTVFDLDDLRLWRRSGH